MELLERFDEKIVNREPNRAAPVRVTTKDSSLRFGRLIIHNSFLVAHKQPVGMLLMILAYGPDAVIAQKFVRIEHPPKQTFHTMTAGDSDEASFVQAGFLPARNLASEIGTVCQIPF